MDKSRDIILAAVILAVLTWPVWLTAYVNCTAATVEGVVTGKHEAFEMPGEDRWRHVFRVTYQYRPPGAARPENGQHPVDASLFHRLGVGSRVAIRYSSSPLVRSTKGYGSFLADSTWFSRQFLDSDTLIRLAEVAALVATALLGFVAYRTRNRRLGWIAALIGCSLASSVLLAGCIVFPLLFWLWYGKPRQGYGWLFLATLSLTAALLYWRIPRPTPLPPGPTREADAIVRRIGVVKQLWTDDESGQPIRDSHQMLDLEYTPAGADAPIHVLDRIDLNSVPGLSEGATVRILYSAAKPAAARIVGGTRDYARRTLVYLLELDFGVGGALALGFGMIFFIAEKVRRWYAGLLTKPLPDDVLNRMSALPPDDPRRIALDAYLHARERQRKTQENKV